MLWAPRLRRTPARSRLDWDIFSSSTCFWRPSMWVCNPSMVSVRLRIKSNSHVKRGHISGRPGLGLGLTSRSGFGKYGSPAPASGCFSPGLVLPSPAARKLWRAGRSSASGDPPAWSGTARGNTDTSLQIFAHPTDQYALNTHNRHCLELGDILNIHNYIADNIQFSNFLFGYKVSHRLVSCSCLMRAETLIF